MGLGYDTVRKWRGGERLVYACVSGYGRSGPMKGRAGYDALALAESELLHITGEEGGGR
jgi:succinate---hydroxymethylglutarate CoA-transferase